MTYDQLVTLDAIVKYGSFKAASESLHKTQPSLSMAIKKLEEEFGIKLFNRDDYRPTLTDDGKAFHLKALDALEKFNELDAFGKELAMGLETEITISIDAICPLNKVSNIFESFLDPHVTTSLNLSVDMLDELNRKVIHNEVDFAIGHFVGLNHRDIEAIPILNTKMIPVVASCFYDKTDGSLDALRNYPQIIVKSSDKASTQVIHGAAKGMKQWFTTDMSIKEQLILNSLGWGRLPEHQIARHIEENRLSIVKDIPTIKTLDIQISLIRNTKNIMGQNTKRLWNYLTKMGESL